MSRLSRREFKEIVRQVMATLPPEIAAHLHNLVVEVADEPDENFLRRKAGFTEEEIADGADLLGFYEQLELPAMLSDDAVDVSDIPDRLWIFKLPHEDEFPDAKQLRIEIRKTVIHELAHHFGFDEGDLARWDANPDPFREK